MQNDYSAVRKALIKIVDLLLSSEPIGALSARQKA